MSENEDKRDHIHIGTSPDHPGCVVVVFEQNSEQHVAALPPSVALLLARGVKTPFGAAALAHLLESVAIGVLQNSPSVQVIERTSENLDVSASMVERARGSRLDS